jgi:carbon-monoxide dehydrogenase small subunit
LAEAGRLTQNDVTVRRTVGPVGSHPPKEPQAAIRIAPGSQGKGQEPPAVSVPENLGTIDWAAVERDGVQLRQSFTVPFGRKAVWQLFSDLDRVAGCMPGARLTKPMQGGRAEGEVNVKLGPIVSVFQGVVAVERDEEKFRGVVRSAGRDARSPSNARAIIVYQVLALDPKTSRVDVSVTFLLSGPLAQFSRSGLVKDVAEHLTRVFARNLEASLSGGPIATEPSNVLDAGAVARSALWGRVRAFMRRMLGR